MGVCECFLFVVFGIQHVRGGYESWTDGGSARVSTTINLVVFRSWTYEGGLSSQA